MDLPAGFEGSATPVPLDAPSSYRTPGDVEPARTLSHRWRERFGFAGGLLIVWGTFVTAFGVACVAIARREPGALAMTPVLALGGSALYVGLANLVNRTRVTITPREITRTDGPLRWRSGTPWRRRRGDRIVARAAARNDVRNGSARWPAPRTHEVVVVSRDQDHAARLFEQILDEADARAIAATLSKWMDETGG